MVLGDFKEFEFGAGRVDIGQVETVEPAVVLDRREAVLPGVMSRKKQAVPPLESVFE